LPNVVTYKDLNRLVQEQIDKSLTFQNPKTYQNQLDRQSVSIQGGDSHSDISSAQLISAVQNLLKQALPDVIIEGLVVEASSPASSNVIVRKGRGSRGGQVFVLLEDTTIPVPISTTIDTVLYLCLYKNTIIFSAENHPEYLKLAKVIIPLPGQTFKFYNNASERPDLNQGYIQTYQEFKLYSDPYDNLEEDSLEKFRKNIGPILADNIIGNIRLSENLKISNTQGSLEMDSSSIKLFDTDGDLQAKFDRRGTFFYDANNSEVARFTRDDARIGNILIQRDSIGSANYVSGPLGSGFEITDSGDAEFNNIRARGKFTTSVFEKDTISSVGGSLLVSDSDVLNADMSAGEVSSTELLTDGDMEIWASSSNLTHWTEYGTSAQETTIKKSGTYSAKNTSAGGTSGITQSVPSYASYIGKTLRLGGWVYSTVADQIVIEIQWTSPAWKDSAFHTGSGWEYLEVTKTIPNTANRLDIWVWNYGGSAVSFYVDSLTLRELTDTVTITGDTTFSVDDVLRIKDGVDDEWLTVTDVSTAPVYKVERDMAADYISNDNPTWKKGTAVVNYGSSTEGLIYMTASEPYSPYIDMATNGTTPWTSTCTKVRLGNLSGITDSMYGALSGYGLYSDNVYLRGKLYAPDIKTATSGSRIELNTCCMAGYNSAETRTFNFDLATGDFCFGNFAGASGAMWDDSAATFCLRGSLNACDICTGYLSADFIQGGNIYLCSGITIGTVPDASGVGPQRTTFDAVGIASYNSSGVKKFQLCDGQICAQDIRLQDPACNCCYSYLNAGALTFHDELGDVPYVKRISDGVACTGTWVCLLGWRVAPKVIVSIKSLNSYNAAQTAQNQRWNIYADTPVQYCNSGLSYGYCFQVHACLELATGTAGECLKNSAFTTCFCTAALVCSTKVRSFFQLWCNATAPANFYYGTLCYAICYRCLGCAVWCASCFCYSQAHASQVEMQTTGEQTQTMPFPCNATWEIMLTQVSLGWTDSTIASGSTQCCLCSRAVTTTTQCVNALASLTNTSGSSPNWGCCIWETCSLSAGCDVVLAGSKPSNVYCTYLCYTHKSITTNLCGCMCFYILNNSRIFCGITDGCACFRHETGNINECGFNPIFTCCCNIFTGTYNASNSCTFTSVAGTCVDLTAYNSNSWAKLCMCASINACALKTISCSISITHCIYVCGITQHVVCDATLYHCYCLVSGAAACCTLQCAHSLCDTYGASCVLDPTGYLNYLAIAYT
jgi:hypothetical protein